MPTKEEYEYTLQERDQEIRQLNETIDELRDELAGNEDEIARLGNIEDDLEDKVKELEEEVNELQNALDEAKSRKGLIEALLGEYNKTRSMNNIKAVETFLENMEYTTATY